VFLREANEKEKTEKERNNWGPHQVRDNEERKCGKTRKGYVTLHHRLSASTRGRMLCYTWIAAHPADARDDGV